MDTFKENFDEACFQSMRTMGYTLLENDPTQVALEAKKETLREALIKKLDGNEKLIDAYDNAINAVDYRPALYIYQQGFRDSVYLLRWMGLLEGSPERE